MIDKSFFPDYHEHQDFGPAMLALSHFIIQWNWAEHNLNVLLWQYAGDIQIGAMYSAGLGNQSRADALIALAKKNEKDPAVMDHIEFAVSAFGKLKSNRNSLAHAHTISLDVEEKKPRWTRSSNNAKSSHVYVYADLDDIVNNLNACAALGMLLLELSLTYIKEERDLSLLKKFSVPSVLLPHPIAHGE